MWDDQLRAETWLRRAIGLARRAQDHRTYCRAAVTLGDVYAARDETTRARSLYTLAMHASRRYGMREARANAVFGLLRVAIAAGDSEAIVPLQDLALRTFGQDHPRTPELILTLSRLWVDTGERQAAREALRRLVPDIEADHDRMAVMALLARAEVEPGTPSSIAEAWDEVWTISDAQRASRAVDRALVDLALAAIALDKVDRVQTAYARVSHFAAKSDARLRDDYTQVGEWLAVQTRRRGPA